MDSKLQETYAFRVNSKDHKKVIQLSGTLRKELKKSITVSQLYRIGSKLLLDNPALVKEKIMQEILEAN